MPFVCVCAVSMPRRLSELYSALKEADSSKDYTSVCSMVGDSGSSSSSSSTACRFSPQQHPMSPVCSLPEPASREGVSVGGGGGGLSASTVCRNACCPASTQLRSCKAGTGFEAAAVLSVWGWMYSSSSLGGIGCVQVVVGLPISPHH